MNRETENDSLQGPCHRSPPGGRRMAWSVLLEGGVVLAIGGLIALAANFISPRGLSLTRDYFPVPAQANTPPSNTNAHAVADLATNHLKALGLQVADHNQAARFFRDPRRDQELIVFVDARDEQHYAAGHAPGAYLFDPYRPESYLPALLPVCLSADTIVIYCTGGNCEDSELAAQTLRDAGVPPDKILIYPGGIAEWQSKGLPIETGSRNSGNIRDNP